LGQFSTGDSVKNSPALTKDRELPIPPTLLTLFKQLEKENKEKKIKGNHLFYTFYKRYNVLKESSINQIFYRLSSIDKNDNKWGELSPQYIRTNLIKILFDNGYSIEEISYIIGTDLKNISKFISYEDICAKVKKRKIDILKKHPFREFL